MPDLPAHCPSCGLTFSSGIHISGPGSQVTSVGNRSQCPRCGTMAPVAEGHFQIDDQNNLVLLRRAYRALSRPEVSAADLETAAKILQQADKERTAPEQVFSNLAAVPSLGPLVELMRPRDPGEFWTMVPALLMLIIWLIDRFGRSDVPPPVINNYYLQERPGGDLRFIPIEEAQSPPGRQNPSRRPRPADRCPCGSGRQFRRCCGRRPGGGQGRSWR